MSNVIGTVKSLDGDFFALNSSGEQVKLKVGDEITQDMLVSGDSGNSPMANINIAMGDNLPDVEIRGTEAQRFDSSLIENASYVENGVDASALNTAMGNMVLEEQILDDAQSSADFAARDGAMGDVNSDLRDAKFSDDENIDEEEKDILEEDIEAGEEELEDREGSVGDFAARDGNAVDVNSGLRSAKFKVSSHSFEIEPLFELDSEYGLNPLTSGNDFQTTITPPTTTPNNPSIPPRDIPNEPPVNEPPVVTPPTMPPAYNAVINLTGDIRVDEGAEANYTISVTEAPKTDLLVKISITHNSTNDDDVEPTIYTIVLPKGETSVDFTIENFDDIYAEGDEDYTVTLISTEEGGYTKLTIGEDTVVTVIDDNTGTPNTPSDDENEPTLDAVQLKVVACDENGNPILESDGITYATVNEVPEANSANYMVLAFQEGVTVYTTNTKLDTQSGSVRISTVDLDATSSSDYTPTSAQTVSLGVSFSVATLDDIYADSGEKYNVFIDPQSFENGVYENVTILNTPATTTITDNSKNTPEDPFDENNTPPVEADLDAITVKLFAISETDGSRVAANSVTEGDSAKYIAVAFDGNGNEILAGETVQVTFGKAGDSATAGGVDYTSTTQTVTLGTIFSTPTSDDYLADNGEKYSIQITDKTLSNASEYETVIIDTTSVTTTILDNSKPEGENPHNPNEDPKDIEKDSEIVQIKLVALDSAGEPILVNGEYTFANEVNEGNGANYMALAFAPGELVFSPGTKLADQVGSVDVTFANGTANGVTSQNATDGTEDFDNTAQTTVSLGTVITTATFDDWKADNGETFTISITDDTYASNASGGYENVTIDTAPVTTTILDDSRGTPAVPGNPGTPSEPHDPNTPPAEENTPPTTEHPETNHEIVQIKLVACDETGTPMFAADGITYLFANEVPEDNAAYYMAIAFEPGATVYTTATKLADVDQLGSVTVSSKDLTTPEALGISGAQTTDDGSEDYTSIATQQVDLNTAFSIDTLDDYMADNGEKYEVVIDASSYSSTNVAGDDQVGYENVAIDIAPVTTTILDDTDTTPNDPSDNPENPSEDPVESNHEQVILKIVACDASGEPIITAGKYTFANEVAEGSDANYMVLAFKPGTTDFTTADKVSVQGGTVTIETANIVNEATGTGSQTLNDGTQDYLVQTATTVTLGDSFSVSTLNDFVSDNNETYNVLINDGTYTHPSTPLYENVVTNLDPVVTNITDDPQEATIVLVATDSSGVIPLDNDGKVDLINTNSTPESGKLYYIAVAVDADGKPLDTQDGKVTVAYGTTTDGTDKDATEATDYVNTFTEATIGTVFEVFAKDDFYAEGDENFTVTISNPNNTPYENPVVDTDNDMVTSTILDNEANKVKENPEDTPTTGTPNEPNTPEDPTGTYGEEDTVYVKITETPSTIEGGELVHTVTLVDANGAVVEVPAGESVTVDLTYTVNSGDFTEGDLSTIVKTVTIDGGTNHKDFTNISIDDFTAEGNEVYTVTITDVSQTGAFENVVIADATAPDAVKNSDSTTGTIKDGVILGDPVNAKVYEDGLNTSATSEDDLGKSLGITDPNTDAYTVSFDTTITSCPETSNGQAITYSYNPDGTILTATRADDEVVFTVELTKDGTGNDVYDFELKTVMDHDTPPSGTPWDKNEFDMPFEFNVTSNGITSPNKTFNVTVVDSVPNADPITADTKEDTEIVVRLADDDFKAGEKVTINSVEYDIGTSDIVIYEKGDTTKQIGSLTINSNGTVTFIPVEDYSNHDTTTSPEFTYTVKDFDGDEASSTVTINVKPVADAITITPSTPSMIEDNNNANEGEMQVSLGLTKPTLSKDQTDKNFAAGDHAERNGEITLTFTNGDKVEGAKIFQSDGITQVGSDITTANQTLKVVIVTVSGGTDIDYTYHHADITTSNPSGNVVYLTETEYQNLIIQHAEDNDTDIKIKIGATSYELDDSDKPLSTTDADLYETATANMTVKINPATDDISLDWNNNTSGLGTYTGDKFTFNTIQETDTDKKVIDLRALLTNTSGTEDDATPSGGDMDGSEFRSYDFTGLPEGTKVVYGDKTAYADADGDLHIDASWYNDTNEDVAFTMTLPEQYGGSVSNATITLNVQDMGVEDDDTAGVIKTDTVNFSINVDPVADQATIQVSQAVGFEDAGRDGGNTVAKDGTINANGTGGIPLDIKVSSDDKDGSEKFDVTISTIPADAVIYYDGALQTQTSNSITILDFDNTKSLVIIPPHNDDTDFTLNVSAVTNDGGTVAAPTNTTIDVIVKNVADAPVGTELNAVNVDEDNQLNFKDIYTTPANLVSYDNSEELTVKIELTDGFIIDSGSPYYIEDGMYVVKASDIIAGNIKLVVPENFSGDASFDLTYVTTEKAGENDSKTWNTDTVSIFIDPIADDVVVEESSTITEDVVSKINLTPSLTDVDGTESITSVKILASTVPAGFELYADAGGATALTTTNVGGTDYYVLTQTQWEDGVYAKNTSEHDADSGDNFVLTVVYTTTDTVAKAGSPDVSVSDDFDHTHTVNVQAVTDNPTLSAETITQVSGNVSISGTTVTVNQENSSFKVPVTTTSPDGDGSETVQKIVISGVPMGVSVDGATYYGYSGSEHNGIWVITSPADATLDASGLQDITFTVNTGADFEERDITITTYTKDIDAEVENDSITIHINAFDAPSEGPGNPPLFDLSTKEATIYEDNNDGSNAVIYNLGKSIDVTNSGGSASGNYAITITDFPEGTTVEGASYSYEEGGKTYYVVTGTGNAADVEAKLSTIIVTPPTDMNTGGDTNGQMTFSATISTYDGGTFKDGTGIPSYTETIIPVTDAMTVAITADNIDEDGTSNLSITLSNPSDGTKTELIGSSMTIKVTETWNDVATGGGTKGTLTQTGTDYNIVDNNDGTYTITKTNGTPFTVDTPITGLEYTPAANRDGSVEFEVSVQNKETGSDVELDSKGEATLSVTALVDTVVNVVEVAANGTEDVAVTVGTTTLANPVKLEITTNITPDGSETFGNIILDEVPNNFTVWYNDGTNLVMATNIGTTGGGTFDINPGITGDAEVTKNKWLVPATTDGSMPEVYINAPVNWSGEFNFNATVNVKEENLETLTPLSVDVTGDIEAVADGMTIAPTLTFGDAFSWVDLKLNANMADVDGSETMSLNITGLDDSAQFRLSDGSSINATHDGATWTLDSVAFDQINNIQFVQDTSASGVSVEAWTVDGTSVSTHTGSETFDVNLANVSGTLALEAGINLDFSKLDNLSALDNVNTIDLSNGAHSITNLTLDDVVEMTGSSNELTITGEADDTVSLNPEGVSGTSSSNGDGTTTYEYNTGSDTVKLTVDDNVTNTGF